MAASGTITWVLGEDWLVTVPCKDSSGAVLDLTGGSASLRIASPTALLNTVAGVIAAPATGIATFHITPAMQVTAGYDSPLTYRFEVRATLADGTITDQLAGPLYIQPSLYVQFP